MTLSHMLDTNTVRFVFENQGRVAQRLLSLEPSSICISAITVAELRYGVEKRQSKKLHSLIDRFLAPFMVAPFGEAEAARYSELYAVLERKRTPIGELDTEIAAHALALGVTLVTNNERHFTQVAGASARRLALIAGDRTLSRSPCWHVGGISSSDLLLVA